MRLSSSTELSDIHSISPEQQRALSVLHSNLKKWKELQRDKEFDRKVLTTNYVCFSTVAFKDLPRKNTWVWNQSNAKIKVQLTENCIVTFQKMNTRKRKDAPKPPSHKLWVFTIDSISNDLPKKLFFIWCEKGVAKTFNLNYSSAPSIIPGGCRFTVIDHKNSELIHSSFERSHFTPSENRNSLELSVADLSFLKPFIEPTIAQEFGW